MGFSLPPVSNWKFWIVCSLVIKVAWLAFFIWFSRLSSVLLNHFYIVTPDYAELLGPVDNYFISGMFEKDVHSSIPYAGRLPGYIFPYFFFKMMFSQDIALTLLVVFQIVFSAIAAYFLALLSYQIFQKRIVFFLFFIFFLVFSFFSVWDLYIAPNTLSICAYVFHLFFLNSYFGKKNKTTLLFSGLFLAWVFFLRGFLGVYFVSSLAMIMWFHFKSYGRAKKIFFSALIFCIPIMIMEVAWVARNYSAFGKIIPLQTTYVPGQSAEMYNLENRPDRYVEVILRKLISAWGGECAWYFPDSEMGWIRTSDDSIASTFQFKEYVFYPGFVRDSLNEVRLAYKRYNLSSVQQKDSLYFRLTSLTEHYTAKYILNNKFRYYVITPVLRIKNLIVKNVVADWPGKSFSSSHWTIKCFKAMTVLLYILSLIAGSIGILFCFYRIRQAPLILIMTSFNVLLLLFLFAEVIPFAHFVYFATGCINMVFVGMFTVFRLTKSNY